jgi:uncharacterized protein YqgC (DUF456 family)
MENTALIILDLIIGSIMLVGLLGLAFYVFPGLIVIWGAALIYGVVTGFTWWNGFVFFLLTLLMVAGSLVDNVLMGASARQHGTSWLAVGVSLTAGIIFSILYPPFGGILAAILALFVVEFIRVRDWRKAVQSAKGMAMGCGWSMVVRFGMGIIMIGLWILWAIWLRP